MSIKVNYAIFKETLLSLAEERPDYVYKPDERDDDGRMLGMCENVQEDEQGNLVGSCIVGHVMVRLGVQPEVMGAADHIRYTDAGELLSFLEDAGIMAFEDKGWGVAHSKELLLAAQMHQDRGIPWGKAVAAAVRRVEVSEYPHHFEAASA